ncbi:MAG: radical SAM protein [Candidatus Woesearchaeota archaeon]
MNTEKHAFDALLIFPPPYIPTELQPGIAAIAGYSIERDKNIKLIDANIDGLEFVLSAIDPTVKESIIVLMDQKNYAAQNFSKFKEAKDHIALVSKKIAAQETFSFRRNTMEYIPAFESQLRQGILEALAHPEQNIFNTYFDKELIPQIQEHHKQGCKYTGIGITDRKQAIPGFLIASKIKQKIPDMKVIVGGNFISRAREVITKDDKLNRELFDHLDYLVYLEGDKTFYELINGKDLKTIDKLIWKEGGQVKHTEIGPIIQSDEFPLPYYKGLKSWTPQPAIAYNFQRGCNFGVCKFCGIMDGYDSFSMRNEKKPAIFTKRTKSIDAIIADMKELTRQGYHYINFTDETFFAKDIEEFSKKIIEEKINIKWAWYSRVEEEYLDKEFCKRIAQAGGVFPQFGVESLSIKSLQQMRKGTDNLNIYKILENLDDVGIMNHIFLLVGNPGETAKEALLLLPFLEKTKNHTCTVKPTWFKLARGSPYAYNPEGSVKRLYTEHELAPNLHYENVSGMSKKAAQAVSDILQSWINRNHTRNYVAGTYCYSQRFFSGYETIVDIAKKMDIEKILKGTLFQKDAPYTQREKEAMQIVWRELIGKEYHQAHQKYNQGNRNPKFIVAYQQLQEKNSIAKQYPAGFKTIDDVMAIATQIAEKEKNNLSQHL